MAQETLRPGEDRFRRLVEHIREAVIEEDAEGRIVFANDRFLELFGLKREELPTVWLGDYIAPEWREVLRQRHEQRLRGADVPSDAEYEGIRKDGSRLWLQVMVTPILEAGRVTGTQSAIFDVTEHHRAERLQSALYRIVELARSAEDLPKLYSSIHAIVGELMYAKNCFVGLHDPATDMVSFPYYVDEKDAPRPPRKFGRGLTEYILRTGQPLVANNEMIEDLARRGELKRTGTASLDWIGVPLKRGEQTFGAFVLQAYEPIKQYGENEKELLMIVSQQIAAAIESKRSETAIRESESKFRAVAETAPVLILVTDEEHIYYANPAAEQATGYSRAELMGMAPWNLVHEDARERLRAVANARLQGMPGPSRSEFQLATRSGEERWLGVRASVIEFGGRKALLATAEDITGYRRAEQLRSALYRISEQAAAANDLPQFFASLHAIVGELMFARNFYIALYDPKEDILTFPYFVDEQDEAPTRKKLARGLTEYVLRTGEPLLASPEVFENLVAAGEVETIGAPSIDWLGVPLKLGNTTIGALVLQSYCASVRFEEKHKDILTFVSQNIAGAIERKRSAEALRSSEERYRGQVEGAVYGIYRANAERFLEVNPALVAMLGYQTSEQVLALRLAGDVYLNSSDLHEMLASCGDQDRISNAEARWKRRDSSQFTVRLSGRIVRDGSGGVESMEMIVEDVSERWMLEQQLHQSRKMEAVGQLAGGIAHDFNNSLTIIRGYNELMQEQMGPDDAWWSATEEVRKATERSAGLIRQLLAFSRKQVLEPRILDLNTVISNLARMLQRLLGEDVLLNKVLGTGLGRIKADPSQIEQILINLAVNARDAMPKGGRLFIRTSAVTVQEGQPHHHPPGLRPGRHILLEVSDTGIGMSEETLGRIFEPFFTTKAPGQGTGLGLSTVYGIVQQSGGHIDVESKPGYGTTFRVYLSEVDGAATDSPSAPQQAPHRFGSETILVVEDEDALRNLVAKVLTREGYQVLATGRGEECLDQCGRHVGPIHLMLTDVVLPGMNGRELAEKLHELRPEVKVIFMSGHTDDAILRHGIERQEAPFIEKPFRLDAMVRKVREVLDGGQSAP